MRNRSDKFALAFWILASIVIFGVNCLHAQSFKMDTNLDYCEDDWYPGSCAQQQAQGGFKNTIGKNATTANENFKQLANNEIDTLSQTLDKCLGGDADECKNVIVSGIISPANKCAISGSCAMGGVVFQLIKNNDTASKYWEELIKLNPNQLQNDMFMQILKELSAKKEDFNIIYFQEDGYTELILYYDEKEDYENLTRIALKGCNTIQKNKKSLALACNAAGWRAEQNNEYHKAAQYYKKACDLNVANVEADGKKIVGNSCKNLAHLYYKGKGVRQNYYKFAELARRGCDLLDADSCELLGIAYSDGVGVPKSLQQAKRFFGKSCDLGNQRGCDEYKELNQRGIK